MKDDLYTFTYHLTSGNGDIEGNRYINQYSIEIYTDPDDPDEKKLIGRATVCHVLIEFMLDFGIDVFAVVDETDQHLYDVISPLFDFESMDSKISSINNQNICVIKSITLLSEYRGLGIGKSLIGDIAIRFGANSGIMALKAFPLQLDCSFNPKDEMEMDFIKDLDVNKDTAFSSLHNYYSKLGFKSSKEDYLVMYMDTATSNPKMNKLIKEYLHPCYILG